MSLPVIRLNRKRKLAGREVVVWTQEIDAGLSAETRDSAIPDTLESAKDPVDLCKTMGEVDTGFWIDDDG